MAVRREVHGKEQRAEPDRDQAGEAKRAPGRDEQHREPEAGERPADVRQRAQLDPLTRIASTRSFETLPARSWAPTATWPLQALARR